VLTSILFAMYSGLQFGWNTILYKQNQSILQQGRKGKALTQKILAVQDSLRQEQKSFQNVLQARSNLTAIMNDLKHWVPDSVWITDWHIRSTYDHSFRGYTTTTAKLTVLQRTLEKSSSIQTVRILESEVITPQRASQIFGMPMPETGLVAFHIKVNSK
jgi:Tfp pilus assembly protein PilN